MFNPAEIDELVYDHLKALALRIHANRQDASFAPTELLHEAWEKLVRSRGDFETKSHFVAVGARAMRQILVDRAKARVRLKRGGGARRTTLAGLGAKPVVVDLIAMDDAIRKLAALDEVAADVLVLRCLGGLTVHECAEALSRSPRSIDTKWRVARSFVATELDVTNPP